MVFAVIFILLFVVLVGEGIGILIGYKYNKDASGPNINDHCYRCDNNCNNSYHNYTNYPNLPKYSNKINYIDPSKYTITRYNPRKDDSRYVDDQTYIEN